MFRLDTWNGALQSHLPTYRGFRIVVKGERVVFGFGFEIDGLGFGSKVDLEKLDREKQQSL